MKHILLALAVISSQLTFAQNTFRAIIKNERTQEALTGITANIPALNIGTATDTTGMIEIKNIPNGSFQIKFSYVGFKDFQKTFSFPLAHPNEIFTIDLEPSETELGEVVIQTTRSSRSIRDIPTRVEAITLDELNEKNSMKPGDIRMLLNESTGIATQQTSAVSGTANIRIQGLDGRYTQFLRDGMPLYQGFSGGLSVMQIAPLDLKQVEFIKGSASTLYGGGAIAGLV
ncbi:MAG: TonB-dependent receptor plug domain-containing protein, partial [Ferruginibacter sp.]